jgi:hypothetical protein
MCGGRAYTEKWIVHQIDKLLCRFEVKRNNLLDGITQPLKASPSHGDSSCKRWRYVPTCREGLLMGSLEGEMSLAILCVPQSTKDIVQFRSSGSHFLCSQFVGVQARRSSLCDCQAQSAMGLCCSCIWRLVSASIADCGTGSLQIAAQRFHPFSLRLCRFRPSSGSGLQHFASCSAKPSLLFVCLQSCCDVDSDCMGSSALTRDLGFFGVLQFCVSLCVSVFQQPSL